MILYAGGCDGGSRDADAALRQQRSCVHAYLTKSPTPAYFHVSQRASLRHSSSRLVQIEVGGASRGTGRERGFIDNQEVTEGR